LLAQTYNINRTQSKPPADATKFHPYIKKPKPREATPEDLKRLFGPNWDKHI
jgi:hypothetical protein